MYSENNRRASVRRANDEFLRRMLGGELTHGEIPVLNLESPVLPEMPDGNRPSCDGSYGDMENGMCPTHVHAPSLAMVYSPKQCWRNLLDLHAGLNHGSIFAELILPFEGDQNKRGTEGKIRK